MLLGKKIQNLMLFTHYFDCMDKCQSHPYYSALTCQPICGYNMSCFLCRKILE